MADRSYKAFIVEGEAREPLIIKNISHVFFNKANFEIITLPAGQNIYMLWKKLKDDEFFTDIIEVLREDSDAIKEQLVGLSRDDFSEVYLFFDYDGHQNNMSEDDDSDVLEEMLLSFDNETENGKLYINYPMVEALRDFRFGKCGIPQNCFIEMSALGGYKELSADRSDDPHFRDYDIMTWKEIIDIFAMKISCLTGNQEVISYDDYAENITPYEIYRMEKFMIENNTVFVLSAFPEFLLDYRGIKLWRSCVRHKRNDLDEESCGKALIG